MKALSVRQPWAWLLANGHKPIENRTRRFNYRGPLLIHAGATMRRSDWFAAHLFVQGFAPKIARVIPEPEELQRGGIIGITTATDCVEEYDSPWFCGPFGIILANPKPLPFHPCKGALAAPFNVDGFCRVCGCTEEHACAGGCYWITPDLCSACVDSGLRNTP